MALRNHRNRSALNTNSSARLYWTAGIAGGLILLVAIMVIVGMAISDNESNSSADGQQNDDSSTSDDFTLVNPADVPISPPPTGEIRVFAADDGFFVFIDGDAVIDDEGRRVTAPCEVAATRGRHVVRISKPGYRDQIRRVEIDDGSDIHFTSSEPSTQPSDCILTSAYFEAPLGESIYLLTVNTNDGRELDPSLSPDGLTLCFAGDRDGDRGLFVAKRSSPYHLFEPPQFLRFSSSREMPAAPTMADPSTVVFTDPEMARIWALRADEPGGEFVRKEILLYSPSGTALWSAAQMIHGKELFFSEDGDGKLRMRKSVRESDQSAFERIDRTAMPGRFPCLSSDGLRQYLFDGAVLRRSRRAAVGKRWSTPEIVARLDLTNFSADSQRRQYWVSDDEQWLIYSGESGRGDLYQVRLAKGRGWGHVPTGAAIIPMTAVAQNNPTESAPPETEPSNMTDAQVDQPEPRPVDPRTLPLPYAEHRAGVVRHLERQEYDKARELLESARSNPALSNEMQYVRWDADDLARIEGFWADVRRALAEKKPGDSIRVGVSSLEFARFENDVITVKGRNTEVDKPLAELSTADLLALVDEVIPEDDQTGHLRVATFLYYTPSANTRRVEARFEQAGSQGAQFHEQLAARKIHLAQSEIERENFAVGLKLMGEVLENFPDTDAADEATQLKQEIYAYTRWLPSGPRQWDQTEPGVYSADATAQPRAMLVSPRTYENFELRLEWKTTTATGQGGVFFRYPGRGDPYANSFKIQLANDFRRPADMHSTGSLFGVQAGDRNPVRRQGEWNSLVIRVEGPTVTVTINDRPVLETTATDPGIPRNGYVALDGATGGISYRNTLLVELPRIAE